MTPLPTPNHGIFTDTLPSKQIDAVFFRISAPRFKSPVFFNSKGMFRYDSKECPVMYVGTDQLCCFVETFGDELIGQRAVTQATLKNRNLYTIFLKKKNKISVVNLSADGPLQIGLDGSRPGTCKDKK